MTQDGSGDGADGGSPPTRLDPARARLVERNADVVRKAVRIMAPQLRQLDKDDLESVGNEALVRAALRYDPDSGIPFAAYAHYRVRGAMLDLNRQRRPGSRSRRRAEIALEASQSLLEQAAHRGGDEHRRLEERVAAARALLEQATAAVIAARAGGPDPETLGSPEDAEKELLEAETRERVRAAMDGLEPEYRVVIDGIYRRGTRMTALAEELGTSTSTISRRHARALTLLAQRFRESE